MIVVDCSVILDLLVRPRSLPQTALDPDGTWFAPSLLDTEVVSAVRGLLLGGRITKAQAEDTLDDYTDLGLTIWPVDAALRRRTLSLAHNLTAYDATSVALAEALDLPLITRDRRLSAGAPASVTCAVV